MCKKERVYGPRHTPNRSTLRTRVTPRLKRGERRFLATEFLFKILFQKWRLFCCRLDSLFFRGIFDFDHDWTWRFRLRFWLQVLDQISSIPIPPRFLMSFAMKTLSLRLKRRSLRLKVPSPFLNKIKTWLRIFSEPKKQVSSLKSVENWAVSGEKTVSFFGFVKKCFHVKSWTNFWVFSSRQRA